MTKGIESISYVNTVDAMWEMGIDSYGPELHATSKTIRRIRGKEKPTESTSELCWRDVMEGVSWMKRLEEWWQREKERLLETGREERRERRRFVSTWNVSERDEVNVRKVERKRSKREKIRDFNLHGWVNMCNLVQCEREGRGSTVFFLLKNDARDTVLCETKMKPSGRDCGQSGRENWQYMPWAYIIAS